MTQKQTLKSIFILLLGAILGSLITGLAIYQLKYKSSYEADYLRLPAQARQIQLNLEQLRLGNVDLVIGNLESNLDSKLVEINMYEKFDDQLVELKGLKNAQHIDAIREYRQAYPQQTPNPAALEVFKRNLTHSAVSNAN